MRKPFLIKIPEKLIAVAIRESKKMPGNPRPNCGSVSHFFNFLAEEYCKKIGEKVYTSR